MSWVCLTFVRGLVKLNVFIRVIMLILLGNDHHNPIAQTVWRMGGWMLIVKNIFKKPNKFKPENWLPIKTMTFESNFKWL